MIDPRSVGIRFEIDCHRSGACAQDVTVFMLTVSGALAGRRPCGRIVVAWTIGDVSEGKTAGRYRLQRRFALKRKTASLASRRSDLRAILGRTVETRFFL
jgi:hypothetical protein